MAFHFPFDFLLQTKNFQGHPLPPPFKRPSSLSLVPGECQVWGGSLARPPHSALALSQFFITLACNQFSALANLTEHLNEAPDASPCFPSYPPHQHLNHKSCMAWEPCVASQAAGIPIFCRNSGIGSRTPHSACLCDRVLYQTFSVF